MAAAPLPIAYHVTAAVRSLCIVVALVMLLVLVCVPTRTGMCPLLLFHLVNCLVDIYASRFRLAAQGKHGHQGHHYEFSNVLFHGLCFWFCARLHAPYNNLALQN